MLCISRNHDGELGNHENFTDGNLRDRAGADIKDAGTFSKGLSLISSFSKKFKTQI